MGDIIHTLPAISDARKAIPAIEFDWVIEKEFADIPNAHPAVNKVIPVSLRRWRKNGIRSFFSREVKDCIKQIRSTDYDVIIDAQGLFKSSILTLLAKGSKHGLHKSCSRGKVHFAYHHKHHIPTKQHAVERVRQLFSKVLHYDLTDTPPDYGISQHFFKTAKPKHPYIVFIHGTVWHSKQWPEPYWHDLAKIISQAGYHIKVPAGSAAERDRANQICQNITNTEVIPPSSLTDIAHIINQASGVIAVDTGLAHLSAALNIPCVTIYGATDAKLTGTYGLNQTILQAVFPCAPCLNRHCTHSDRDKLITPPCYQQFSPQQVWKTLNNDLHLGDKK